MDRRIIRAASNAVGYDVGEERVAQAVVALEGTDTRALRRQLRDHVAAFDAAGGRGVELADEIDTIRIALAARSIKPGTRER